MELYFPSSFSLKDKRRTLKSVLDQVKDNMNVSASEVGYQDRHRQSRVAFAVTGSSQNQIEQLFDNIEDLVEREPTLQIRDLERSVS